MTPGTKLFFWTGRLETSEFTRLSGTRGLSLCGARPVPFGLAPPDFPSPWPRLSGCGVLLANSIRPKERLTDHKMVQGSHFFSIVLGRKYTPTEIVQPPESPNPQGRRIPIATFYRSPAGRSPETPITPLYVSSSYPTRTRCSDSPRFLRLAQHTGTACVGCAI